MSNVLAPDGFGAPKSLRARPRLSSFADAWAAGAEAPLVEVYPAAPGDEASALGFALAWAASAGDALIVWATPEASAGEHGAAYAAGLVQFGVRLSQLICVRTRSQNDALWAVEEALKLPGALAICTIAGGAKPLSLAASRRLLLAGEKSGARALLLRFAAPSSSAAWMGWRIASAPSQGEDLLSRSALLRGSGRELGAPAFSAHLARYRGGPSGQTWLVEWNADARALCERALDGDLDAASGDGSAYPRAARAG